MLSAVAILKDYAMELNYKLETMGEKVRDAYNFYQDTEDKWERQKEREHARVMEQEYRTLMDVHSELLDRITAMEKIEKGTVSPYVVKILENLEVGDKISVNFTYRGETASYYGTVEKIVGLKVWVKNGYEMDFFESLGFPQLMDINLERVWFHTITKKDGTEYCG
jgi:hypothetical protein